MKRCLLSCPPRSSTAWTNRAWRVLVHLILGALMLLLLGSLDKNLDLMNPEEASEEPTPYWCNG